MKKLTILTATVAIGVLAPAAAAAPPQPFGHPCSPQNDTLFCPTTSDAQRVPSFDGVPLDVDVTLPPTGDGPFPAVVMLHGWGGSKSAFQSPTPEGNGGASYHYNNTYFARQGYAVITPSARGFGRSCGAAGSRAPGACDRGWLRLADQRYEVRDVQHLLGRLVDERVVRADALGVTGISYGGIQSHSLARLRDRIRLQDGSYRRWRSPAGRRLRIAAAWARWGATDLTSALTPNGRFLDTEKAPRAQSRSPLGIYKKSYNQGLLLLGRTTGFVAPAGGPFDSDLLGWADETDSGEPYGAQEGRIARELTNYHSSAGLSGTPAPLLVQNGWTDDLFPAPEALRAYRTYENASGARVSYQFGDLGHSRGANKPAVDRYFNDRGAAFFAAHLKGEGRAPRHNAVTAFTQTCPFETPAGGPIRARSWDRLHPRTAGMAALPGQTITSSGGNPATARAYDQLTGANSCLQVAAERAPGTAIVQRSFARAFTLLGQPTVRARVRTKARGATIVARLWDVHQGRQTLVGRGAYRLTDRQQGRIVFQLWGNGWRFGPGHQAKLELLGSDPNFMRPSNFSFRVRISRIGVRLPGR